MEMKVNDLNVTAIPYMRLVAEMYEEFIDCIDFMEGFEDDESQGEEFAERLNRKRKILKLLMQPSEEIHERYSKKGE